MAKPCQHENFGCACEVTRISESEGGDVVAYSLDVSVKCLDCDEPFVFRGVPFGVNHQNPTMSIDGTELRAPIAPQSSPDAGRLLGGVGVRIVE